MAVRLPRARSTGSVVTIAPRMASPQMSCVLTQARCLPELLGIRSFGRLDHYSIPASLLIEAQEVAAYP